jgi:hypothetical protein
MLRLDGVYPTKIYSTKAAGLDPNFSRVKIVNMSKLETIEAEVRKLPVNQAMKLQDWLADYLEDLADLNPEFIASIERGNVDLREGRTRTHRPEDKAT